MSSKGNKNEGLSVHLEARKRPWMSSQEQKWTVSRLEGNRTLQEALRERLHLSNRGAKSLLDARTVFVNGSRVWMARHKLRAGDVVEVRGPARPAKPEAAPEILYRDAWLIGVNKPPGCLSDGDAYSVEARIRASLNLPTARALHRLDRDTSGVLLINAREEDRGPYVELFKAKALAKTYLCLARGRPEKQEFTIRARLDGKEAVTHFRVRRQRKGYCLLACEIPTGRTHQIRRHLAIAGLGIVGDKQYGQRDGVPPVEREATRHMLHASDLTLPCPHKGAKLHIHAPLPPDFQHFLKKLI